MSERLLLNVFLSLTPVVVYQLIMFTGIYDRNAQRTKLVVGFLCGIAADLCMRFPIVDGKHFLWDLRWVPFLISVTYGGYRGVAVTTAFLLSYRAALGGALSWSIVAIDAVVLFALVKPYIRIFSRSITQRLRIVTAVFVSSGSYIIVITSIYVYFVLKHNTAFFVHQGVSFYFFYGGLSVGTYSVAVILIENLFQQAEFRQQLQQTEKIHLLGDMAASFAHEIRNPLTVAKGFIQLTAQSLQDAKNKERLALVVGELHRAEEIISDYLSFSKPQVEEAKVMSLTDTLHSVVALMNPYGTLHQVRMQVNVQPDLFIFADQKKIKQIIMNLLKNAIEAIPSNGGTVVVRAIKQKRHVKVTIVDDGVGMTDEQIERLGTPFYSTKSKGTGLGLMVAFRLLEAMNGSLKIESKLGEGTTSIVQFPLDESKHAAK